MKVTTELAIFVFILVTFSGFAVGLLQTNFSNSNQSLQDQKSKLQFTMGKVTDYGAYIFKSDSDLVSEIWSYTFRAKELSLEYEYLKSSLTQTQKDDYLALISDDLYEVNSNILITFAYSVYSYFINNPSSNSYYFATVSSSGYDFAVQRTSWDSYHPVKIFSLSEYLTNWNFPTDIITELNSWPGIPATNNVGAPSVIGYLYIDDFQSVLNDVSANLQVQLNSVQQKINDNSQVIDRIAISLSIITVSSVLAASMYRKKADKVNKKNFSLVLSDIKQDKHMLVSDKDTIAFAILIIVLLIAIVGMFYPFIKR